MQQHLSKHHTPAGRGGRFSSALWIVIFIGVIAALLGYIGFEILRPRVGTKVPVMETRNHVEEGKNPSYNSNPPTSGDHYEKTEEWGIYDKPLIKERLIHNLEHGGIIIYYNCNYPYTSTGQEDTPEWKAKQAKACDKLKSSLKDVAERLIRKDRKIIVLPSSETDAKIVLTSWGWIDKMDTVDEDRIFNFFNDHINQAPERVF